jgi:T4 RnlA family RNA ligase
MTFQIPTLRQAKKLVKTNEAFISKVEKVNGANIHHFDYLLASPKDFTVTPYAKELRGICYVTSFFGLFSDAWPMLHKFHNLNECEGYMEKDLKDYILDDVEIKEDGSVVSFIKVKGKWIAKSHYSFASYQATQAQKLLTSELENLLDHCLDYDIVPIFELVGKNNRVVVEYDDKISLRLISARYKTSGNYLGLGGIRKIAPNAGVEVVESVYEEKYNCMPMTQILEHFKNLAETVEDIEGWVLTLYNPYTQDYKKVKIKTKWYLNLHGVLTGTSTYANNIIEMVLNKTIDDLLTQMGLEEGDSRLEWINEVTETIDKIFNHQYHRITDLIEKENGLSDKEFAEKYKEDPYFTVIMRVRKGHDLTTKLKEYILHATRRKEMAEQFLEDFKDE